MCRASRNSVKSIVPLGMVDFREWWCGDGDYERWQRWCWLRWWLWWFCWLWTLSTNVGGGKNDGKGDFGRHFQHLLSVSKVLNAFLLNCSALPRGNTFQWRLWEIKKTADWNTLLILKCQKPQWSRPRKVFGRIKQYLAVHCDELVRGELAAWAILLETSVPLLNKQTGEYVRLKWDVWYFRPLLPPSPLLLV